MIEKQQLLTWHNQILDFLQKWRESHPGFTFAPRIINRKDRLKEGFWFQGDENYVFAGMSSHNDETNKTRQVGFVVSQDKAWLELVFKSNADPQLEKLYKTFIEQTNGRNSTPPEGDYYHNYKWFIHYNEGSLEKNLRYFLEHDWAKLCAIADEMGILQSHLLFPEDKMLKALKRIEQIRTVQHNALDRLVFVDPPAPGNATSGKKGKNISDTNPDYEEQYKKNKKTGNLGEFYVIECERERLCKEGWGLENAVKAVYKEPSDAAGYDIRSVDSQGNPKYIEVKTTTGPQSTPFYITSNELDFAREHEGQYELWRLYDFVEDRAKIHCYQLKVADLNKCVLDPVVFKVS